MLHCYHICYKQTKYILANKYEYTLQNVMENNETCCPISVFICFAIISNFAFFLVIIHYWFCGGGDGECMVCMVAVEIMLHSCISYHQGHALPTATVPRRLRKDYQAACGAVILRFHGVSSMLEALICDTHQLIQGNGWSDLWVGR